MLDKKRRIITTSIVVSNSAAIEQSRYHTEEKLGQQNIWVYDNKREDSTFIFSWGVPHRLELSKSKTPHKDISPSLTFQIPRPLSRKLRLPASLAKHKLSPLACVTDELSKAADTEVASHHRGGRGFCLTIWIWKQEWSDKPCGFPLDCVARHRHRRKAPRCWGEGKRL